MTPGCGAGPPPTAASLNSRLSNFRQLSASRPCICTFARVPFLSCNHAICTANLHHTCTQKQPPAAPRMPNTTA